MLRFRVLGASFFRSRVLCFRDLGSSFSRFGCFVLRSSFSSASFSKLPLNVTQTTAKIRLIRAVKVWNPHSVIYGFWI